MEQKGEVKEEWDWAREREMRRKNQRMLWVARGRVRNDNGHVLEG
jgi:hypothetical protein